MIITSKIKKIFDNNTLKLLASICDARRIPSNVKKMIMVCQILKERNYDFVILGGATNRLTIQIDGYAVKIAIDSQGYKDNLVEYAICPELYPDVSKTYETSGYILVAECVRLMTEEEWLEKGQEILHILDNLSDYYLLGDVGYIKKNRTNWGITDNNKVVILDYAYVHRATETLFVCEKCGDGVLTYDDKYDILMCSNRTGCHARYTYNERKRIQGDQVDLDMIEERKEQSIVIGPDETSHEVQTVDNETFIDGSIRVIHSRMELDRFLQEQEEQKMAINVNYDDNGSVDELIDILKMKEQDPEKANEMMEDMLSADDEIKLVTPGYILADDYTDTSASFTARPFSGEEAIEEDFPNEPIYYNNDDNDLYGEDLSIDSLVDKLRQNHEIKEVKAIATPEYGNLGITPPVTSTIDPKELIGLTDDDVQQRPERKPLIINGKEA